jgi:peptide/nickel transport system substrate-binding protein
MHMIIPRRALLAGAAALPFLPRAARAQARPGYLRFGLSAFPPNLRPWVSTGVSSGTVKLLIHSSLLRWDHTGALQGDLAQSWSLDSDGAWVFKLRGGAVFHNGDPVTADDVKWSIEQIADPKAAAYMRAQFQAIARVETPDAHTVRLVTKTPLVTLPSWFAEYNVFVLSRKSDADNPIGAGPFVLTGQERGTSIDIAAFDKYDRPGLPKLKAIRFIAYADENLRVAALRAGDVDMIEYVPWQAMAEMQTDPRLRLEETQYAAFMDVLFNATKPPYSDPRVRQAVAHAVKRDDIVKAAFFGRGKGLEGVPIVQGTPFYDDKLAHGWNYDPARAKALLAAAGYPNGFKTTLLATETYSMHKDTAVVVQRYLADIGIQAELQLPDWATRVAMGNKGQYDIAIHGVAAENNDPDGLTVVLDTSQSPTFSRSFGLKAPRTIAALARGREEFDQAKRVQIYNEMQVAALAEVPLVGLAWRSQGYGMDKRVTGFTNLPGMLSTASGSMLAETSFA